MANATAKVVPLGLSLEASDVSGQNRVRVADIRRDTTVGELVRGLVGKMGLPSKNPEGRDVAYTRASSAKGGMCTHPKRSATPCAKATR